MVAITETITPTKAPRGVPNLTAMQAHRNAVEALYHLTRVLDATRPVIGNDGWEASATDILGIHDYDGDPQRLRARYEMSESQQTLFDRRRPGGRILTLDGFPHRGQPIVLTEFGGVAYDPNAPEHHTWGYSRANTAEAFHEQYRALLRVANETAMFSGFCYTQFADTFQETEFSLTTWCCRFSSKRKSTTSCLSPACREGSGSGAGGAGVRRGTG